MAFGQGLAQFPSAFLGGMGGAGSLVQTLINLKSGGQTVLSTFVAGLILFVIAAKIRTSYLSELTKLRFCN
jgi:MFS superfamily sulfate permease-like transporter